MKKNIGGRIYDTDKMITLASRPAYNNGTYAGQTELAKTKSGSYAIVITSNGQDCYRQDDIRAIDKCEAADEIDGWTLDDEETAALIAEGILAEA